MTQANTKPTVPPYTSSELLDYVETLQGKQVYAYKKLAGGSARSSYSIQYYPAVQTFDVFADICDDWQEMQRSEFVAWHGDDERIWHIHDMPS